MASDRTGGFYASAKLVSTGVSGIDYLLGGGVPGGAVILIEESKRLNGFSDAIARQFLAEGFYRRNRICFASDGTIPCLEFLQTLPQAVINEPRDALSSGDAAGSNMEIAWRYEHLPVKNVQVKTERKQQSHRFDFNRPIPADDLRAYKQLLVYDAHLETPTKCTSHYSAILAQLRRHLRTESPGDHDGARWHRIVIRQVGSPLWQLDAEGDSSGSAEIVDFMYAIRAFMRQKGTAVALISMSTAFIADDSPILLRMRQLADVVFRLDPLDAGEKEKPLLDYLGFFRCLRTPSINSIQFPIPDCIDYGFKLKRKEFLIERLHLPPDLSESASRAQLDSFSCSSSSSRSKLDF